MNEQNQPKSGGRPITRTEGVKRVTIEISPDDWRYISEVAQNRTKWIIEAIKEKREREQAQ